MLIGPISCTEGFGYIDDTGRIRIPFVYEELGSFSEGLAWFLQNNKVGFINEYNEVVIPPTYDRGGGLIITSNFHSGLAPVRLGNKEGYINIRGDMQIPCQFERCSQFAGNTAIVCTHEGRFSTINKNGEIVCHLPFNDVAEDPYEDDIIKAYLRIGEIIAPTFINRYGKIIGGPFQDLEEVYSFSPSPPYYAMGRSRLNGLTGFLDRQWRTTLPFQYGNSTGFAEGLAGASTPDHQWGYIDIHGNWSIKPEYSTAHHFRMGTASVKKGKGKMSRWHIIDAHNQTISSEVYEGVDDYDGGFRCVWSKGLLMVIDVNCNTIWSKRVA